MISQTPVKYFFLVKWLLPRKKHIPRSLLPFEIVLMAVESEFEADIHYCSGGGSFWGFQIYVLGFAISSRVKHLFQSGGGGLQACCGPA